MAYDAKVPVRGNPSLYRVVSLSFAGALVCAVLFFVVLQSNLPATDAAYGQPVLAVLWDPFVIGAIVLWTLVSGILAAPVAYYCLRGRRLLPSAALAFIVVAIENILVTPPFGAAGWLGAYVALVAVLLLCRLSKHRFLSE